MILKPGYDTNRFIQFLRFYHPVICFVWSVLKSNGCDNFNFKKLILHKTGSYSCVLVCSIASVMSESFQSHDYSPPGFSVQGIFLTRILKNGVKVQVAQSCLTLCDPLDYTVHYTLQARILEWVTIPFWSGLQLPTPEALPNLRIESKSPAAAAVV